MCTQQLPKWHQGFMEWSPTYSGDTTDSLTPLQQWQSGFPSANLTMCLLFPHPVSPVVSDLCALLHLGLSQDPTSVFQSPGLLFGSHWLPLGLLDVLPELSNIIHFLPSLWLPRPQVLHGSQLPSPKSFTLFGKNSSSCSSCVHSRSPCFLYNDPGFTCVATLRWHCRAS